LCATPKRSSGCTASAPGPTSGLLKTLRTGPSREELAQRLGARRTDLLDARLELGVALGELACDNRGYRIRGKRAAGLADDRGDAVVAIVEEAVSSPTRLGRGRSPVGAEPGTSKVQGKVSGPAT